VVSLRAVQKLAIPLLLSLLFGCAAAREARQERRAIEEEATEAAAHLDATSRDDALLSIAKARQSRGGLDVLRRYANHDDPRARREAIRGLGLVGDPSTQGTIEAALQDAEAEVRIVAAFALSQLWAWPLVDLERVTADAAAEVALDAALTEELSELRRGRGSRDAAAALIRALGEIGDTPTDDDLWELAGDRQAPILQVQALLAIGMRGKRGQPIKAPRVPTLAAALTGGSSFAAAWTVGRSPIDDDAKAPLEAALLAALPDADEDTGAWILRALGRTGGEDAAKTLGAAVQSDAARQRLNAVRGAATAGFADVLILATHDADDRVAIEALRALGGVPGDSSWAALQPRDTHDPQREAARVAGLGGHISNEEAPSEHDPAVLAAALAAALHPAPEVRSAGFGLLSAHPDPTAHDALLARVDVEQDAKAALALASAIAERQDPAVEGQLLSWLNGEDATLGAIAAEGLGEREDDHITAALLTAWRAHPDPKDWERRVAIIRAVGGRSATPPDFFGEALGDADPHVRLAAFFALAERAGRSQAGSPPLTRPEPQITDAWFGVADVTRAVIATSAGDLTVLLYPKVAPAAVANFVTLAEEGFFDGVVFHRVVPDFVIQSGDPDNTGWGGPGWTLPDEFSPLEYRRGTLGMARSDKDTAGSQWFITHSPQPHLTGHYTAFGQLMTGWDVLDAVVVGDRVESVTIERKASQ
jgi:cyclophilin family peptidyl-prolyl cis-trans isomerase